MADIKFKMGALEFYGLAKMYGETVAQALWERKGHQGPYIHWVVALPGWVETMDGTVLGFEEYDQATKILKEILDETNRNPRTTP